MLILFQSAIHCALFVFLLRVADIKSTGGEIADACCFGERRNSKVIPHNNTDVIHQEDIDVAEERSRVKAIQDREGEVRNFLLTHKAPKNR